MAEPTAEDIELAERLLAEWDEGRGTSKSQLELREWNDGTSHGRRFDRFIRKTLGVPTTKRSKQSDRIEDLEGQLRRLGLLPIGARVEGWEPQLQHARNAALAALKTWNDPSATFRTGTFALLFVTAWNSLAIALLQQRDGEWRELDDEGNPTLFEGMERSRETLDLVRDAFPESDHRGLRENVHDWIQLRNCVAHRHLPALDAAVIPQAQAGLLNFENALADNFGRDFLLGEQLSVPLQLSGFRDPGVLSSLKRLQASLPLDVQAILSRAESSDPDLLMDQTYMLRVAFIPAVPASGRSPDAVAYFLKPGQVPEELEEAVQEYVVLPKVARPPRPNLGAKDVVRAFRERTGFHLTLTQHLEVARAEGVRPSREDQTTKSPDARYCEYVPAAKLYLYNEAWVDRLVDLLGSSEGWNKVFGHDPTEVST